MVSPSNHRLARQAPSLMKPGSQRVPTTRSQSSAPGTARPLGEGGSYWLRGGEAEERRRRSREVRIKHRSRCSAELSRSLGCAWKRCPRGAPLEGLLREDVERGGARGPLFHYTLINEQ